MTYCTAYNHKLTDEFTISTKDPDHANNDVDGDLERAPDVSGNIFEVSDVSAEEQDLDQENSAVFVDSATYNQDEEKRTTQQMADEDAIAEEALYLAHEFDDEVLELSDDESGAVEMGGGAGDTQGEGGQAEAMEEGEVPEFDGEVANPIDPAIPAIDLAREGWIYWVGYLANKFRYRHRELNLGLPTSQYRERYGAAAVPPYLNAISLGGLTVPSDSFRELIEGFERVFVSIHGETLSYESGAISRVRDRIAELYPNAPPAIVRAFARGRLFLRIKFLNFVRHEEEAAERAKKKKDKAAAAAEAGLNPGVGGPPGPSNRAAARNAPAAVARRNIRQARQLGGRKR